jgi:hypothetical protein
MNATSTPNSPSRHIKQESLHIEHMDRPSTPIRLATDQHDPDSPCMIALPTVPSRTTINVKPSMTTFHSPSHDLDVEVELDPSPMPPHYHHFYDGNKSAASSATAFDTNILHGSESYLIIDPRNNVHHNDQAIQDAPRGSDGTTAPKRKKVDFNKPLKFWLIFVSLCFSCLLSALDLVSLATSLTSSSTRNDTLLPRARYQTAISTALPDIINDLQGQDYIWVGSAYALTSTAFLPFCGSMANILGRKYYFILPLRPLERPPDLTCSLPDQVDLP